MLRRGDGQAVGDVSRNLKSGSVLATRSSSAERRRHRTTAPGSTSLVSRCGNGGLRSGSRVRCIAAAFGEDADPASSSYSSSSIRQRWGADPASRTEGAAAMREIGPRTLERNRGSQTSAASYSTIARSPAGSGASARCGSDRLGMRRAPETVLGRYGNRVVRSAFAQARYSPLSCCAPLY